MSLIEQAQNFRREIDATKKATGRLILKSDISEEELKSLVDVYEPFKVGEALKKGDIRRFNGILYEVIQAHTTQADWEPNKVPALFKVYEVKKDAQGNEVVPEFKQPAGGHDAYRKGDKVSFKGAVYESVIDNNAYSPETYPQGWRKITD